MSLLNRHELNEDEDKDDTMVVAVCFTGSNACGFRSTAMKLGRAEVGTRFRTFFSCKRRTLCLGLKWSRSFKERQQTTKLCQEFSSCCKTCCCLPLPLCACTKKA